jgi:tight adherence protein B
MKSMITWVGVTFVLLAALAAFLIFWGVTHRNDKKEGFGDRLKVAEVKSANSASSWRDQVSSRLQGAADRMEKVSVKKGKTSLADTLAQADIRMRTSEWFMIQVALAVAFGSVAFWRWGVIQAVLFAVAAYLAPSFYAKLRTGKRLRGFNTQLPQTLNMISNGLKAGYSLPQALENVAETMESPSGEEFGKAIREINLGGSIDEALANLVRRVSSEDLDLVVTAILVHRNVGGNLAEILSTISHTIRERIRIRGEIRTLTAQARLSGLFISVIPIGLGILLYFIAPSYFGPMTSNILGWAMLVGAGCMIVVGNLVMRKFIAIEV